MHHLVFGINFQIHSVSLTILVSIHSSTSQLISVVIHTLVIHHSFTLSLQAQNLPFQQILSILSGNEGLPTKQTNNKAVSSASMPEKKMLKCFRCARIGHRAADCRTVIPTNPRAVPSIQKRESTSAAKLAKINHVQVESCTPEQHSGIIFGAKPILNVPEINSTKVVFLHR